MINLFQDAVEHLKKLDQLEDKEIRQKKEPNEELQLYVTLIFRKSNLFNA